MRGLLTIKMKRIMVQIRNILAKKVERARMSESVFPQNLSGSWATGSWPSGEVVVLYCKRQGAVRRAKKKPPDAECRLLLLAARHWAADLGPSVPTRSATVAGRLQWPDSTRRAWAGRPPARAMPLSPHAPLRCRPGVPGALLFPALANSAPIRTLDDNKAPLSLSY